MRLNNLLKKVSLWIIILSIGFFGCEQKEDAFLPDVMRIMEVKSGNTLITSGAQDLPIDGNISILFSHSLEPAKIESALSISSETSNITYTTSYENSNSLLTITPVGLEYKKIYKITITESEIGTNGEKLASEFVFEFESENEPPEVLFSGGEGTEANPFLIGNAEDLNLVRSYMNSSFKQIADINLADFLAGNEEGWTPIGTATNPFTGHYDGAGFTISNLMINSSLDNTGLFGVMDKLSENDRSAIIGLTVNTSTNGIRGNQATAILLGRLSNGTVDLCHTNGTVNSGGTRIGGLVGSQDGGHIKRCSSTAKVSAEASRVGGLVGLTSGTISESFATGDVSSGSARAGGLVGSIEGSATVSKSYATGNVTAETRGAALAGYSAGILTSSYATGAVTITLNRATGDFPGYLVGQNANGTSSSIYYPANITLNYSGGSSINTEGTAIIIQNLDCSNPILLDGFNFTTDWTCTNSEWPKLAWQN
jgi:hypothetical protein